MKIGVRAEDKNEWEARTPMVPDDVRKLESQGISIIIQSSRQRAYTDDEYTDTGIGVRKDINDCRLIFGLKEIPIKKLQPEKIYFVFAHVAKGQAYNMPMLKRMMELGVTLVDYERIVDKQGRRLIFFGRHAGIAGMINSLWALGQRFAIENCPNPLENLRQARTYENLAQARQAMRAVSEAIKKTGIPPAMHPLIVGFAGYGNVSRGAQEILNLLPFKEIRPQQLAKISRDPGLARNVVYKVVFKEEHSVQRREKNRPFNLQEYFEFGSEKYKNAFGRYLDHLTLLINGNYWDARFPRILTLETCRNLWAGDSKPKLKVIGDISCDINGSIQCTVKPSYPDNPVYVYHPNTGEVSDGFSGHGPVIMAVEILPAEIPRESSTYFSGVLKRYIPDIIAADWDSDFSKIQLPPEIKRAVILYRGQLTPDYRYIHTYL